MDLFKVRKLNVLGVLIRLCKKRKMGLLAIVIFFIVRLQAEVDPKKYNPELNPSSQKLGWDVGFDKLSVDFSSTSINNQEAYAKFSTNYFRGNSQILTESRAFFHANYYAPKFVFFNTLFSEYGRSVIYARELPRVDNTTLDRFFVSTDFTYRLWDLNSLRGLSVGPFILFGYQTQFTKPQTRNRTQILNLSTGFKIFDNPYIKTLNLGIFGEQNFTYNTPAQSLGVSLNFLGEIPLKDYLKFSTNLGIKQYLYNNLSPDISPSTELDLRLSLDTSLYSYFFISPFLDFHLLKGKNIPQTATHLILGVSLSYSHIYIKAKKPKILPQKEES